MSISYFNVANREVQPKLWLCKPNKQIISPLLDIHNLELHIRLGAISEMSFSIPTKVERNHELIDNPLLTKIKDRYYVKMIHENQTEYFVFLKQNKQVSNNGKSVTYQLYSTAFLLNDKFIYKLEESGWTLTQFANKILEESSWRVETVDGHFAVMERYMDISSKTILQALFDLAENFNAIILFNSIRETVSFYNPSNIGLNKGLKIKDNRFLESLNVETKADEMITRLYIYGKDGLNIRSATPTGSDYIEDFSYFMHGFECDDEYNVLKSSEYMSDGLCVAIMKYRALLDVYDGEFNVHTSNLKSIEARLVSEQESLNSLRTQLNTLLDRRDVLNSTYGDAAPRRQDHIQVTRDIAAKNTEISNKNRSITNINSQKSSVILQIERLNDTLDISKNLTPSELMELNKFIITKEHVNESIIEVEDLLNEAFEVFETLNEPPINISLNIEGYLESLKDGSQVQKISLGDIVRVEDAELRISYRLKVLEIHFNFDDSSINLTIANGKEVIDDNAKLVDMIYSATNTSTIVNMDRFKWNLAITANDNVSRLLNSEWDAVKNAVLGGYNQSITISERGLVAKDTSDPLNWLILQNGVLAITNDNGNSWKTAITKNGVHAERIVGKILIGNRAHIEDEEGIITITGASQKVYDLNGNVRVELGRYSDASNVAKYGLKIHSGSIEIVDGLPKSQIEQGAVQTWDSAERNAKTYADALKNQTDSEIADVFNELVDFKDVVNTSFLDGIIEQGEAIAIQKYINTLNVEKGDIERRYNLIVNDIALSAPVKTRLTNARTAFNNAHTRLITAINNAIADRKTTVDEKANVDVQFTSYSSSLIDFSETLSLAIDDIQSNRLSSTEQDIKQYTEQLVTTINQELVDVDSRINSLGTYLDTAFKDGIIDNAELKLIESYVTMLNTEKADVDAQYNYIYDINALSSTGKTNLSNVKTSYDTAFSNLMSTLSTIISDGKVTSAEKTTMNGRFTTYRTASANLKTAFETAIDTISTARVTEINNGIRTDLRLTSALPTSLTLNANGITATTSNSNNFARLDHRGLYIQGGALDIRTGAASNVGVIINGSGFHGYNSSGTRTVHVNSSTGRMTISGSFTIQSSEANSNSIRIDETGIYAYNSSGGTKFSLSTTGNATFSGTISASSISSTSLSGGTISASSISGGTISATSISSTDIDGGTITGATIQTKTSNTGALRINSTGLSLYNSSGTRTVFLSTSGTASFSGDISSSAISGGTITGAQFNSGSINISTDARVGNNLYLGTMGVNTLKRIYFNNDAYIAGGTGTVGQSLMLYTNDELYLSAATTVFRSGAIVDFQGVTVRNLAASTAVFG